MHDSAPQNWSKQVTCIPNALSLHAKTTTFSASAGWQASHAHTQRERTQSTASGLPPHSSCMSPGRMQHAHWYTTCWASSGGGSLGHARPCVQVHQHALREPDDQRVLLLCAHALRAAHLPAPKTLGSLHM